MDKRDQASRIYVGNLTEECTKEDLELEFEKCGKISSCEVKKTVSGAPFAFIEFEDPRDAQDAIREKDGIEFQGRRLRVEAPLPPREDFRNDDRRGRRMPPKRGRYVIIVSGLPPSGSWQDLKDHLRDAGEIGHADVFRGGVGEVSFFSRSDMEYAIDKFDGSTFKSHEGEKSRLHLREKRSGYRGGGRGSRSPYRYRESRRGSYGRDRSTRRSYSRNRGSMDRDRRRRSRSGSYHRR